MKIAAKPTIFVGIGGTGFNVLTNVRRRLMQRCGTADLPFYRWIYLDTQPDNLEAATAGLTGKKAGWTHTCQMLPSQETVSRLRNPSLDGGNTRRRLEADAWFDADALARLSSVTWELGVGGRRMYGRLGFLAGQNLAPLADTISQYIDQLYMWRSDELVGKPLEDVDPPYMRLVPELVLPSIDVVVVASGGGGTGSGCFIDIGYLMRHMRRQAGWQDVNQFGYAMIARPGMGTANHARNSAGLMVELNHYRPESGNTYETGYLNLPQRTTSDDPPYDMTFVTQPCRQAAPLQPEARGAFGELEWLVAEDVVNHAISMWPSDTPDTDVDLPLAADRIAFAGDMGLNPFGLESFGIEVQEFPAGLVHRHLYGARIRDIASAWTEVSDEKCGSAVEELRVALGLADSSTAMNVGVRNPEADRLKDALIADCQGIQVLAQLEQAKAKARTHDDKGRPRRPSPEELLDVVEQTKRVFQQKLGAPVPGEAGTVYATVTTNAEQLASLDHERSVKAATATMLLDVAVAQPGGPATARAAAETLAEMVGVEVGFIGGCLDGLDTAPPTKPDSLHRCWQYANDALLHLVLTHKRAILEEIQGWLGEIATRTEHLASYLTEWASAAPQPDALNSVADCPAMVLPMSVVHELENTANQLTSGSDLALMDADAAGAGTQPGLIRQLRDLAKAGFPRTDRTGNHPTLFAVGPPRQHDQTDFAPMVGFEEAVFGSIESGPASPYEVAVLDLLQREAAGGDPPNLAQRAEILLGYDRQHQDYVALHFNGSPTYALEQVQPSQPGYAWYAPAQQARWVGGWPGANRPLQVHVQHPGINSQTVLHQSVRCSIVWEHILGYDRENARILKQSGDHPMFSDQRIQLPPDPQQMRRAQMLLFGSVVLGLWTYLGGNQPYHSIQYNWVDDQNTQRQGAFHAHERFHIGTGELAVNPDIMDAVELKVHQYVRDNAGPAADGVQRAADLLDQIIQEAGAPGSSQGTDADLLQYNVRDVNCGLAMSALNWFAGRFQIKRPKVQHPYAVYAGRGERIAGNRDAAQDGYFCDQCGYNFGLNMPPYAGRCPVDECGHPFGPHVQDAPPASMTDA